MLIGEVRCGLFILIGRKCVTTLCFLMVSCEGWGFGEVSEIEKIFESGVDGAGFTRLGGFLVVVRRLCGGLY